MPGGINDPNPFYYGTLARDEAFADREAEVAELVSDLGSGQDVVIFAPRRYGKSSLVTRAGEQLVSDGAAVAHVDLLATTTKEKLAGKLADAIFRNVASRLERVRERALGSFRGLQLEPTVVVDPEDGSIKFRFAIARAAEDIDTTLERLFEIPGELGAAHDRRVVLVFDEFQEILRIDRELPRLMRSVFQRQPAVARAYLGSKRHLMEEIFIDANEPFWRSAKHVELGLIDARVFGDFVARRFADTGRAIDRGRAEVVTGAAEPRARRSGRQFVVDRRAVPRGMAASDDRGGLAGH
jgi:uncharacterized protein